MKYILLLAYIFCSAAGLAQVGINNSNQPAHSSAMLDVSSTTRGLLIPRLTSAQRTSMSSYAKGLIVYDSTTNSLWVHNGTSWEEQLNMSSSYWAKTGSDITNINSSNVGIGSLPGSNALLHVNAGFTSKYFIVSGTYQNAAITNLGSGTRMVFFPGKAAFRTGFVLSNEWDNDNVGGLSFAGGYSSMAKSVASFAYGDRVMASAQNAVAMGNLTIASGQSSSAFGDNSQASGSASAVFGEGNASRAHYSFTTGLGNVNTTYGSAVVGMFNDSVVSNLISTSSNTPLFMVGNGDANNLRSNAFLVLKDGNIYIDPSDKNNGITLSNSLLFGAAGSSEGIRSKRSAGGNQWGLDFLTQGLSRMSINNNGNVMVGLGPGFSSALLHTNIGSNLTKGFLVTGSSHPEGTVPNVSGFSLMMYYPGRTAFRAGKLDVSDNSVGFGSGAGGIDNTASNVASFSWGSNNQSQGSYSTSFGYGNIASGGFSFSGGEQSLASGNASIALGSACLAADNAVALGNSSRSQATNSFTAGLWNVNKVYGCSVLGIYNDSIYSNVQNILLPTNPVFVVGNGDNNSNRSNALLIRKNGNVYIDASGKNDGTLANSLIFGEPGSLAGIQSKKTAGGNQFGLDLFTAGTTRMSITSSGNVGIGNNTPNAPLAFGAALGKKITLYPGASGDVGFGVQGNLFQMYSDYSGADIAFGYGTSTAFTEQVRIKGNTGNMGIGTNNPSQKLHVVGNICYTGSIAACSDIRYKTNLLPLGNVLSAVMNINAIYYDWNPEYKNMGFTSEKQIGFSAQEIEKYFPEIVQTNNDGYKAVDYSRMTPILVEAVKEQQQQLDKMKAENEMLKERLEKLEQLIGK